MTGVSPIILASSVFLTSGLAFSAGYLMSSPTSHAAERSIVNPDAWSVEAPKALPHLVRADPPKCNPWDISDIAMEAMLEDMIQRGWRPPGSVEQALSEATPAQNAYENLIDDAPAPGQSLIAVVNREDADRMWRDADAPKLAQVATEPAQPMTPIP